MKKMINRWESLKVKYFSTRKEERKYIPSGSAAVQRKREHEFVLFQKMTFLDDLCKPSRYSIFLVLSQKCCHVIFKLICVAILLMFFLGLLLVWTVTLNQNLKTGKKRIFLRKEGI